MTTMPVNKGFYITSGFGARWGTTHWGTDYGRDGGSGGHPIFAVKDGTVARVGPATGFGQWIGVDHPASNGGGETIYGHIIPEVRLGQSVTEGQRIGRINPDSATNGGVAPHLHLEWHRFTWVPPGPDRLNPATMLKGARWPGQSAPTPAPAPAPSGGQMKNWDTLDPAKYTLVGAHRFTRGRARPIDRIIIHHNAANNWSAEQVRDLWNTEREASAHYQVESDGTIAQLVNDSDTAWHAANADINARSIGIEHANISGPPRWQISDKTVEAGAHLVAAICRAYKLGRPTWGRNVFPHSQFASTSCPVQLAPAGEDHTTYMQRAGYWYDNPGDSPTQEDDMTPDQARQLAEVHRELTQPYPSRSKYRVDDRNVDTLAGMVLNIDGRIHEQHIERIAQSLGRTPEQVAQAIRDAVKAGK